jgi:vitamin B12 transporter
MRLMAKLAGFFSVVGLISFLATGSASAQEMATLRGTVKDPSGALISDASVTLTPIASGALHKTQTDTNGTFTITGIPSGLYTLQAEHTGFVNLRHAIQIGPSNMQDLDLTMAVSSVATSVEVRASRDEIRDTLSPGAVTVVYPEDVKGEFKSLPELLDQIPGVYVNRVSGNGQYTTVSIRGSSPTEVNIYIDGVPYNLASEAAADLSTLSIANVERVEVYRGAVPARFSGAPIGGAINIVTKNPSSFKVTGAAGAATLGGRQFSLGLNGPVKGGKLLVGLDEERSAGDFQYTNYYLQSLYDIVYPAGIPGINPGETYCEYQASQNTPCTLPADRTRLDNSYGKDNVLAKWQGKDFVAKISYLYLNRLMPFAVDAYNGMEDVPWEPIGYHARHDQTIHQPEALLGWNHNFRKLITSLNLNLMDQDKRYTNPDAIYPYSVYIGGSWSHYHTRRYGSEADAIYQVGEHAPIDQRFEVHGDWVKETLHASANGMETSSPTGDNGVQYPVLIPVYTRFTTTAQLQDTITIRFLHNLEITPIGRLQRLTGPTIGDFRNPNGANGNTGWKPTANIALKERIAHGWQAFATYGKYVRYPNFYEIYGDGIRIIAKTNSDGSVQALQAEIGHTLDAGVGWDGKVTDQLSGHHRLTYFERRTDNNITLEQNPLASYYTNTGTTYQHGIEFEGSLHYGQFAGLQSAITLQDGWYPTNAYYEWGMDTPVVPAPGRTIPTLNAPYLTSDVRLDLHFLEGKLTAYGELKYLGRNNIGITPVNIQLPDGSTESVYEGARTYEQPLTTLDLGAHWKMPHGGILSGGVRDLFNQGPKQILGGSGLPGEPTNWQTCSTGGPVGSCPPWDLINNTWTAPLQYNVFYPQQGRTLYINLAWQFDRLQLPQRFAHGN